MAAASRAALRLGIARPRGQADRLAHRLDAGHAGRRATAALDRAGRARRLDAGDLAGRAGPARHGARLAFAQGDAPAKALVSRRGSGAGHDADRGGPRAVPRVRSRAWVFALFSRL